jgi:hypothetical protein
VRVPESIRASLQGDRLISCPQPGRGGTVNGSKARRFRWANVVVIVVSAYLMASAVWHTPEQLENTEEGAVASQIWLPASYILAGLIGMLSLWVALKRPAMGRVLTAMAGLLVLSGFFGMREVTPTALLSIGLSGVVLLIAAGFLGPMPTPEDEGKRR